MRKFTSDYWLSRSITHPNFLQHVDSNMEIFCKARITLSVKNLHIAYNDGRNKKWKNN